MRPNCLKLASLAHKTCTLYTFSSSEYSLLANKPFYKNVFVSNSYKFILNCPIIGQVSDTIATLTQTFHGWVGA